MADQQFNFNNTTPPAPADSVLCGFQTDGLSPVEAISMYVRAATLATLGAIKPDGATIVVATDGTISAQTVVGDTGAGGNAGIVPAPSAGDAALDKFLSANGSFSLLPLTVEFDIADGSSGSNVCKTGIAPRAGAISGCIVIVHASDASITLTFDIVKNGSSIFAAPVSIAAGAAVDSEYTFAVNSNLTVAKGDKFQINITSGAATWSFVASAG